MTAAVAWSLAQDCISIISSLAEPQTMAKRSIEEDVHHFSNDKSKTDYQEAVKLLKKQHRQNPLSLHVTRELLVSMCAPAPSQKKNQSDKPHSP